MSYTQKLIVRAEVDGQLLRRIEVISAGRKVGVPAPIHLKAGEKARNISLGRPLPANASPDPSFVLIATDRPGVIARLAPGATSTTCRESGNLLTGTEDIFSKVQAGSSPYYQTGGCWLNHEAGSGATFDEHKFAADTTQDVDYDGDAWAMSLSGRTISRSRFIWAADYVDLGRADDGKVFQFWFAPGSITGLTSAKIYFGSYPYGTDVDDDEVTAPAVTQSAWAGDGVPPGYYWVADFTGQIDTGGLRWNHIVLQKTDFTAAGTGTPAPAWNRITIMDIELTFSGDPGAVSASGSAVYFGDAPNSVINSAAVLSRICTDRTSLHLSLDAPADADANVHILASIS